MNVSTATLLIAADALRKSSDIQDIFSQAEKSNGRMEWMDFVEPFVERPILAMFGDPTAQNLARLRFEANSNTELKQYAHWYKYNRAKGVPFGIGEQVKTDGITVYEEKDGGFIPQQLNLSTGQPTIIIGSSRT